MSGSNEIVLKTRYSEKSNLEAIYLLGDFGVQLEGAKRMLTAMPQTVDAGDICLQGFPFYSGAITYHVPVREGAQLILLPQIGGACAKVNGRILGWDPFEAGLSGSADPVDVEIILTRRNTFGPLHDAVPNRPFNGPFHWVTEGDDFSVDCVLEPSGLLQRPVIM